MPAVFCWSLIITRDLLSAPGREWLQIDGQSRNQGDFNLSNVFRFTSLGKINGNMEICSTNWYWEERPTYGTYLFLLQMYDMRHDYICDIMTLLNKKDASMSIWKGKHLVIGVTLHSTLLESSVVNWSHLIHTSQGAFFGQHNLLAK